LNAEIAERPTRLHYVEVYIPLDEKPFSFRRKTKAKDKWETSNQCRVASQVVIGVKMLELLILLEGPLGN
jgi:hypothetical protein